MNIIALTAYVLVWPIIASGVLVVLVAGVVRDMRAAAQKNERMV
jgi:hypothetical protein